MCIPIFANANMFAGLWVAFLLTVVVGAVVIAAFLGLVYLVARGSRAPRQRPELADDEPPSPGVRVG